MILFDTKSYYRNYRNPTFSLPSSNSISKVALCILSRLLIVSEKEFVEAKLSQDEPMTTLDKLEPNTSNLTIYSNFCFNKEGDFWNQNCPKNAKIKKSLFYFTPGNTGEHCYNFDKSKHQNKNGLCKIPYKIKWQ